MGRPLAALALACLLVIAGCNAPLSGSMRSDPVVDQLGWENGYWYDDPLSVTTADGLNASEREAVVARSMARIERIRGLEFEEPVPVEVISRAQYRANASGGGRSAAYERWNDQVWEALLLVGEDRSVSSVFDSTLGSTVQGYYSPSEGQIVVVSDAETPTIDRGTLSHELVHALQDQHFGLGSDPPFQDAQLAENGVIEGDANYVQRLYERRCGGEWDCLGTPTNAGGGASPSFNMGLFVTIYTPYATGPGFVAGTHQRGGWDAVNGLYESYPVSTEQVIHPDAYPGEKPAAVRVRDRSNGRWNRFDLNRPAHDRVGEASIYAMLWANGQIEREGRSLYDYDHPLSAGWGGDRLVPYRDGDRFGYVWAVEWDTREDAREFVTAYRAILEARSSRRPDANTYVLPESDAFGDAFRVVHTGKRVRVVNGPTVASLDGIHG